MDGAIETKRLTLRTLSPSFLRSSLAGALRRAEDELQLTLPEHWPSEPAVLALRLSQLEAHPEHEPWLTRAIGLRSESRLVGLAGFHGPPGGAWLRDFAPGGVEFGYQVDPPWRRRGIAIEACRGLMAWASRVAEVPAFVLSINAGNEASIALASRLGFSKVGSWTHEVRGVEDVYRYTVPAPDSRAE